MALATCHSRAQIGIDAPEVWVETHLTGGLPAYSVVGLPEAGVRESKDRVRSALINSRFDFPCERITTNLAPADLPKEGGRFDLAIAVSILSASAQLHCNNLKDFELVAELNLAGNLRPVKGVLSAAMACKALNKTLIVAKDNLLEAQLVSGLKVVGLESLLEVTAFLNGQLTLEPPTQPDTETWSLKYPDFSEVYGQYQAKRAMEIAAAGNHNLLMVGPPGSGKTMLATRLPGILPDMSDKESIESAVIQSVSAQGFSKQNWRKRMVRAPHHSSSSAALVGGGSKPKPGEVSLAHAGVLFLDELPEFDRKVLESLREPIENGHITISRAASQVAFPARFQLIAAMNPCPCGYYGQNSRNCRCSTEQVKRYLNKLSGPLLDRIDLHIQVAAVKVEDLSKTTPEGETTAQVRQRVLNAHQKQKDRANKPNAHLSVSELNKTCQMEKNAKSMLEMAMNKLQLSARSYHRLIKVARTIADLDNSELILSHHMAETLTYRQESALPIPNH